MLIIEILSLAAMGVGVLTLIVCGIYSLIGRILQARKAISPYWREIYKAASRAADKRKTAASKR